MAWRFADPYHQISSREHYCLQIEALRLRGIALVSVDGIKAVEAQIFFLSDSQK